MMLRTSRALAVAAATLLLGGVALADDGDKAPPKQAADAPSKAGDAKATKGDKAPAADAKADKAAPTDKAAPAGKPGDAKANPADAKANPADAKANPADAKDAPADKPDEATLAAKKLERETRAKTQRTALRADVLTALKDHPITDTMRQELKRHAQTLARLERIRQVGAEAKDDVSAERASKLVATENARHDKWMHAFDPNAPQKVGAK